MIGEERVLNIISEERRKFEDRALPTVMVIGASGCGKSTLINTVFGRDVAAAGVGAAVTKDFHFYDGRESGIGVNLVDAEGWELGDDEQTRLQKIRDYLEKIKSEGKSIQTIWHCISIPSKRVQDMDLSVLELLTGSSAGGGNVCVVFTMSDLDSIERPNIADELKRQIRVRFPRIECFRVCNDKELNEKEFDIKKLIAWSSSKITDEQLNEMFVAAQQYDVDMKRKRVEKTILSSAGLAATAGAVPIPFADAIPITAIQIRMITRIGRLYGFNFIESLAANGGEAIVTQIGKFIARNLTERAVVQLAKLIPGGGAIIGGAINTGVAYALTYAVGKSVSEYYYSLYKRALSGESVTEGMVVNFLNNEDVMNSIRKNLNEYLRKKSNVKG